MAPGPFPPTFLNLLRIFFLFPLKFREDFPLARAPTLPVRLCRAGAGVSFLHRSARQRVTHKSEVRLTIRGARSAPTSRGPATPPRLQDCTAAPAPALACPGTWQLAAGTWQLAPGTWQLAQTALHWGCRLQAALGAATAGHGWARLGTAWWREALALETTHDSTANRQPPAPVGPWPWGWAPVTLRAGTSRRGLPLLSCPVLPADSLLITTDY